MNGIDTMIPPCTPDSGKPQGNVFNIFLVGFFGVVVLSISYHYISYICKRSLPPPPSISTFTTTYEDEDIHMHIEDSHRYIEFSRGINDDVLVTFPTFLYSNTIYDKRTNDDSCCSICLAEYKEADIVRLLPACGHLYHVSCIDTWLKANPTCPMCRDQPLSGLDGLTI